MRRELEELRRAYEARIADPERRLQAVERPAPAAAAQASPAQQAVSAGGAFNPQISVILDGSYYTDDIGGRGAELYGEAFQPSHAHAHGGEGHAHGVAGRGFNLQPAELVLSATVDPYFDARAMITVSDDGDAELEEAYAQTRALPYGLRLKAGKFLSDIGYSNVQHPHQWDFTDQSLPYLNLLGDHGLLDLGLQLTWLPDWPVYTLFGAEILQGDQERFGAFADADLRAQAAGAVNALAPPPGGAPAPADLGLDEQRSAPRLYTGFIKVAPDLGAEHALKLGGWLAYAPQHQEVHELEAPEELHALQGDARLWGLDAVYRYDGAGAYGQGDLKLQAEYLRSTKDLNITYDATDPALIGQERRFTTDGLYLQGWYGLAPRWRAGLRYDVLGLTNEAESGGVRLADFGDSDRWSAALTWLPTEYSLSRLQWERASILNEGGSGSASTPSGCRDSGAWAATAPTASSGGAVPCCAGSCSFS
jgi:hypothetical protein